MWTLCEAPGGSGGVEGSRGVAACLGASRARAAIEAKLDLPKHCKAFFFSLGTARMGGGMSSPAWKERWCSFLCAKQIQ